MVQRRRRRWCGWWLDRRLYSNFLYAPKRWRRYRWPFPALDCRIMRVMVKTLRTTDFWWWWWAEHFGNEMKPNKVWPPCVDSDWQRSVKPCTLCWSFSKLGPGLDMMLTSTMKIRIWGCLPRVGSCEDPVPFPSCSLGSCSPRLVEFWHDPNPHQLSKLALRIIIYL